MQKGFACPLVSLLLGPSLCGRVSSLVPQVIRRLVFTDNVLFYTRDVVDESVSDEDAEQLPIALNPDYVIA